MHLLVIESDEEKKSESMDEEEGSFYEMFFCPCEKISKATYIEKWRELSRMYSIYLGKLFTLNEKTIIKRLETQNIKGVAVKASEAKTVLYFYGITKLATATLFELVLQKTENDCYGAINYKYEDETNSSTLEDFFRLILSLPPK